MLDHLHVIMSLLLSYVLTQLQFRQEYPIAKSKLPRKLAPDLWNLQEQ